MRAINTYSPDIIARSQDLLRRCLEPAGRIVYSVLRHRSRSNYTWEISYFIAQPAETAAQPEPYISDITAIMAAALQLPYNADHNAIRCQGLGCDNRSLTVQHLAQVLYSDPAAIRHRRL